MRKSHFWAKSNGESLDEHSVAAAKLASAMCKGSFNGGDEDIPKAVWLGALLHDIGKCCEHFQQILKTNQSEEEAIMKRGKKRKKSDILFRHNEIGWAFLRQHLKVKEEVLNLVVDAVYWHHGITNELGKDLEGDVLEKVPDGDIRAMRHFLEVVAGGEYLLDEPRRGQEKAPLHFDRRDFGQKGSSDISPKKAYVRACVISGDRTASALGRVPSDEEVERLISDNLLRKGDMTIRSNAYAGPRFDVQYGISMEAGKTTLVKAPAGFGKTSVGLIWDSIGKNRMLWVCPRNMVGESVYNSILHDTKMMGMDPSVELFLRGEVIESHKTGKEGFTADIIVTNIDSFLFPSIRNSDAARQYFINNCDVVFDEFHELIDENALFASFVNIMRVRHRITTSRTLLLSATPIEIPRLWASMDETVVLPNAETHYPAAHQEPILVRVGGELKLDGGSNLVVSNSIARAQRMKKLLNAEELVHSEFESEHKHGIYEAITKKFGRNSPRTRDKSNVCSTHVLQSALDVSFANIHESVVSPQASLQRIGRGNRWGDYEGPASVWNPCFINEGDERHARMTLYDENLAKLWFNDVLPLDGKTMTLDEIYNVYNAHMTKHRDKINAWIDGKLKESMFQLEKIYPVQLSPRTRKSDIKNADSNRLRSNGNQVFFIVRKTDGSGWSEPMTHTLRESLAEDFKEAQGNEGMILRELKDIIKSGDARYDYEEELKTSMKYKRGRLNWSVLAKRSNTPYPRFDEVYDEEYGLITVKLLNELRPTNPVKQPVQQEPETA